MADVAAYSRLMSADEEGRLLALKAIRRELAYPKIAEHRGRSPLRDYRSCPRLVSAARVGAVRRSVPSFSEVAHTPLMPDYRHNRIAGGTAFLTVNLLDCRSNLLVARIDACATPFDKWAPAHLSKSTPESSFPITCTVCGPYHQAMGIFPVGAGRSSRPSRMRSWQNCAQEARHQVQLVRI
jgi:hypothetical protein